MNLDGIRQYISTLGYNAGLPQFGVGKNTTPGTPYSVANSPQQVSQNTQPALTGFAGGSFPVPTQDSTGTLNVQGVTQPQGSVLGTGTQNVQPQSQPSSGGGGSAGPGYASNTQNQTVTKDGVTYKADGNGGWIVQSQQNAQDAYNTNLAAIQERLNAAREQARGMTDRAKSNFDYLTTSINDRYPKLIQSTEQKKTSALDTIGQQATDTSNAYARADMQTRRAAENAALQTRMNARAGNRLGSSFYNDAIGQNKEALNTQLGASNLEAISKKTAYDTQKNDTTQYYNDAIIQIENSKNDAAQQAYMDYQNALAQADALAKAGFIDYNQGVGQAQDALNSRLSQIDAYANALATQAQQFEQTYGKTAAGVGQYTPDAATTAAIGNNTSLNNAAGFNGISLAAPETKTTSPLWFGAQKQLTLQDILNGINSNGLTIAH